MQTLQLARLLREEGINVHVTQTNAPYWPAFVGRLKLIRAVFRFLPYLFRVWRIVGRANVIHLMANSGWSWQLFSAPVIWIGWLRRTPVIVNYRGGEAREYMQKSASRVKPSLSKAATVVVPSGFLEQVFAEYDVTTQIVPNIIDIDTFSPSPATCGEGAFTIAITRNLEPIYGLDTAIKCFAIARKSVPELMLKIAGSGPQLAELQGLVQDLELGSSVSFLGRLEREEIVSLYRSADLMLNPSLVDNMPNSVLEALACGLPVVSTNVGGVPFMVKHRETAMLVEPGNPQAMAEAIVQLHADQSLQENLRAAGLGLVQRYSWPNVKQQWLELYRAEVVSA